MQKLLLAVLSLAALEGVPQPQPPTAAQLHNEGLDAVLVSIQNAASARAERPRTRDDLIRLVAASSHEFLRARGFAASAPAVEADVRRTVLAPEAATPSFEQFSARQRRYLVELDTLLQGNAPPRVSEASFRKLGQRALRELGPSEAQPVVIAASVAEGSVAYWRVRSAAWDNAVQRFLVAQPCSDVAAEAKVKWWKVAAADAFGAAKGALTGGGLPGAVIGGVATSAGSAIRQALA